MKDMLRARMLPTGISLDHIAMVGLLCVLSGLLLWGEITTTTMRTTTWSLAFCALLYYSVFCLSALRLFPAAFVLLLWFIFARFTTMVSGIAIEGGGYMHEILMTGEPNGAFIRLAGVYTFGVLLICTIISACVKAMPRVTPMQLQVRARQGQIWIIGIFALVGVLCLLAFGIGFKHGFPLLTGTDRILYWRNVDNRFLYFFLGNRVILASLLGMVFAMTQGWYRKISFLLWGIVLIVSFLFAEKFTSISMILFAFVTPVFLLKEEYLKRLTSRLIIVGSILSVLTLPAILTVYGVFDNPKDAITRLQARATSQAQLWFYADQKAVETGKAFQWDTQRVNHNIKSMLVMDGDPVSETPPFLGAKDFMAQTMASDRYEHYLERGVTLTMATESYLLELFGRVGMLPAYALVLFVYTVYLLYLYYAIQCTDPIRVILASKMLIWANFALNQGYVWYLLGMKSMILIAVIILYEIGIRMIFKKQTWFSVDAEKTIGEGAPS